MVKGIFGGMFDFNQDGTRDAIEQGLEFQFFNNVVLGNGDSQEDSEDEDDGED